MNLDRFDLAYGRGVAEWMGLTTRLPAAAE